MKIVRVTLNSGGTKFFLDRPYDADSNEFDNCNNALQFLTKIFEENKVLAVMLMPQTPTNVEVEKGKYRQDPFVGAIPAMINLGNIAMIAIENAGVYDVEDIKE